MPLLLLIGRQAGNKREPFAIVSVFRRSNRPQGWNLNASLKGRSDRSRPSGRKGPVALWLAAPLLVASALNAGSGAWAQQGKPSPFALLEQTAAKTAAPGDFGSRQVKAQANGNKKPSVLLFGSSVLVGHVGQCFHETLEANGAVPNSLALCGAASRTFEEGRVYSCDFAKARGQQMRSYLGRRTPFGNAFRDGISYAGRAVALKANNGKLLVHDALDDLKPDLIGFILGDNESGYGRDRDLSSAQAREAYKTKLRAYIHANNLVDLIPEGQACFYVAPTWVSMVSPKYGKTNEEVTIVNEVIGEETGGRCQFISGTRLMAKGEVATSDGLHLNKRNACVFGTRIAQKLISANPQLAWQSPKPAAGETGTQQAASRSGGSKPLPAFLSP